MYLGLQLLLFVFRLDKEHKTPDTVCIKVQFTGTGTCMV